MTPAGGGGNMVGQFGDTTYTKVFVGGLAWETQKDTMKKYFEQFGDILEAVVITDKATSRSKGYGFVTFREPDAAMRACVDAAPVIDGRRANCNLASLGVQRSKPSTPKHGAGGRNLRVNNFQTGFGGGGGFHSTASATATAAFPHYAVHQGIPYNLYGYSSYSPDYTYPTSYYNVYGGASAQYPAMYGSGIMNGAAAAFYPYFQFTEGTGAGFTNQQAAQAGYGGIQYPHHMFQYSTGHGHGHGHGTTYPHQHYAATPPPPMSLAPTPPTLPSVFFAVPQA